MLYTVHITAFSLGGRFSGHGVIQRDTTHDNAVAICLHVC